MGAGQSVISVSEFSDRVLGTVAVMLAPQLDSELTFKACDKIQDEDKHCLPLVIEKASNGLSINDYVKLYSEYYNTDRQAAINKYLEEHVLDSEEHIAEFLKLLVTRLNVQTQAQTPSMRARARTYQQPVPSQSTVQITQPDQTERTQGQRTTRTDRTSRRVRSVNSHAPLPAFDVNQPQDLPPMQGGQPQELEQEQILEQQAPQPQQVPAGQHRLEKRMRGLMNSIDKEAAVFQWGPQSQPSQSTRRSARQHQVQATEEQMAMTADLPEAPETLLQQGQQGQGFQEEYYDDEAYPEEEDGEVLEINYQQ